MSSCGQGAHCAPFENHVSLVLTAYCKVFLKACPKLDHMTHFGFHGNCLGVFKVAQTLFSQKPLTKDTAEMALILAFNESVTAKIALCTYLKPTVNGDFVRWV